MMKTSSRRTAGDVLGLRRLSLLWLLLSLASTTTGKVEGFVVPASPSTLRCDYSYSYSSSSSPPPTCSVIVRKSTRSGGGSIDDDNLYQNFFLDRPMEPTMNIVPNVWASPAPTTPEATPPVAAMAMAMAPRMEREAGMPPPRYEIPMTILPNHQQAVNIGPLLGYDKGYPWLRLFGPHMHFDTRLNYVEPRRQEGPPMANAGRRRHALNIGPLLGLDKGYPWEEDEEKVSFLGRSSPIASSRTQNVEPNENAIPKGGQRERRRPPVVGQAVDVGPLLGLDKGYSWGNILSRQPVALRTQYVEDQRASKQPKYGALSIGPLLMLDKGIPWKALLGAGAAAERCRIETFVQ